MAERFDIVIVGAGMAGASLAAELARTAAGKGRVLLLEAESQPGYHATGRSAAFWNESYGGPGVQPLTTASGVPLRELGLLKQRGALTIGRAGQEARVEAFANSFVALGVTFEIEDRAAIAARMPGLLPGWTIGAFEPDCSDIDVAGLHQHDLAAGRSAGVELWTNARLVRAAGSGKGWHLDLADGRQVECTVLVNAAGAWADPVASLAGVRPLGITPLRRTVVQLRTNPPPPADLPLVLGIDEDFYFKPESGRLWLSPHDETASPPCAFVSRVIRAMSWMWPLR